MSQWPRNSQLYLIFIMTRRRKLILIVLALIVLIILLFLLVFFLGKRGPTGANVNAPVTNQAITNQGRLGTPGGNINAGGVTVNVNAGAPGGTAGKVPSLEDNLKKLASNFAERFGSYSNQNQFENFRDLEVLMSEKMKTWTENYILETKAKNPNTSVYYGLTTKAIKANLISLDEKAGKAEVLVSAQRWEAKETTTNIKVFYQDIGIKFVFENKEWKVDGAFWK